MFVYWGRRGALTQFTLELARAAQADPLVDATISISRQNENFANYQELGSALFAIDTFKTNAGALLQAGRIAQLRRTLYDRLRRDRAHALIELMPHIWSPLVMPVVAEAGARYCTIVHDAAAHPGDRTTWVKRLVDRTIQSADLVLTLSSAVAGRLSATSGTPQHKIYTLFHPDLGYGVRYSKQPPKPGEPWRLLFLGRIMSYKGLPLFLDAVDYLRGDGVPVEIGVLGEGDLGPSAERLSRLNAEVVNRWLTSEEIGDAFRRYHVIVLSHTEASQSGVAAAAFGAGVPAVATPVGGLVEQVIDGVTGILAPRADAPSLAEAVKRLLDPAVYSATCANVLHSAEQRSMSRFVADVVSHALYAGR